MVRVYDKTGTVLIRQFYAYDSNFMGGVRVATGDLNGDGVPDIITAPGPGGGPDIRVFDGKTGALIREFMAYSPFFKGGVFVAVGDVNGDHVPDIITAPDAGGGPDVRVWDGKTGKLIKEFMAYDPHFHGGVRVAVGDVNADGHADVITAPGAGGGPEVRVFSGSNWSKLMDFYAYSPFFTGGVYVAAGDVNGDGHADIITGPGKGGGPHVEVFSGASGAVIDSFMAYNPAWTEGVRVAAADVNGDGKADILTQIGAGTGAPVQAFSGANLAMLDCYYAFDPLYDGGCFIGGF
jgi:hypothetical protein